MKKLEKGNDAYVVPALRRGLQILEMFSRKERVLSINDFARGLGVSASSIYRTVITLTEMGYLKKVERNCYELGAMVLSNGFCYLASREIVQVAAPYLLELRDETSSATHLAVREGVYAAYIYRAPSLQRLAVNVPIGTRFMCHTVAAGRALLTGLSDEQILELFAGIPLDLPSTAGPTSLLQIRQMITLDKARGYSVNQADLATAIAVPIKNYADQVIAAINVSGPDTLMERDGVQESMVQLLLETAQAISVEVGGRAPVAAGGQA
ncbi:MAG: IclR family transcriptional regulator [Desulfopila sp.]